MSSESASHQEGGIAGSLHEKHKKSGQPISNRQLRHWAYVLVAVSVLVVSFWGILYVGYSELPKRTLLPSRSPTPMRYPTPTPLPTWGEPTAFVKVNVLRIFDSFGVSGNYVSQLQSGDRVLILAQSADGAWTQVQTWNGYVGWVRTDRLLMASTLRAPVPTVRAPTPPEVLFRDDFQDLASGLDSQVGETGEMYYQNDEYVIRVTDSRWIWWTFYPQAFMDCEIKVEARPTVGEHMEYGLVFRSGPDGKYIFGIFPSGGYRLRKVVDENWIVLTGYAESDAIYQGYRTNRLKVRTDGPLISLYVNDQLLQTITDTTFSGGQIGLMVNSSSYYQEVAEVHFDNLEVRSLTEYVMPTATPEGTPTTAAQLEQTPTVAPILTPSDDCRYKYTVMRGENLFRIALRYGVSVPDIRHANESKPDDELLREGNVLCIPSQSTSWSMTEMPADPTPIPGSGCRFMHVVRAGDGWFRIEMRYGVSREDILEANDLPFESVDYVNIEDTLCIP